MKSNDSKFKPASLLYLVGIYNQDLLDLGPQAITPTKPLLPQLTLYNNLRLPEILKRPRLLSGRKKPAPLPIPSEVNELQKVQSEQRFQKPKSNSFKQFIRKPQIMKPQKLIIQKSNIVMRIIPAPKNFTLVAPRKSLSLNSSQSFIVDDLEDSKVILEKSNSQEDSQFYEDKMEFYDQQRDKLNDLVRRQSQEAERQKIKFKEQVRDKTSTKVESRLKEVDGYQLTEILGKGSYAMVKAGVHKQTFQTVAIKMYDKGRLYDPVRQKNVYKEIEILKECDHPNIVKLRKVVETQKFVNLIMEMGGRTSLRSYLKKQPHNKLNEEDVQDIFYQLIQAVDYLHQKRIVHRDIKLDNILIDDAKKIHLIDFGFATRMPQQPNYLHQSCGTPPFMSPEVLPPFPKYNETTDVWSCGVVLHLMITGRFPFPSKNEKDLFTNIKKGRYQSQGSGGVWDIIALCLEKDFQQRLTAENLLKQIWVQGFC